jgi:hypothetical protein
LHWPCPRFFVRIGVVNHHTISFFQCLGCWGNTFLPCAKGILNQNKLIGWFGLVFNDHFQQYFSYISWRPVLLVEETGVPGENHRPVASHWQTLSHKVVSSTPRHERGSNSQILVVISTDFTGSCKSNYHTITTTTDPAKHVTWQSTRFYYFILNTFMLFTEL